MGRQLLIFLHLPERCTPDFAWDLKSNYTICTSAPVNYILHDPLQIVCMYDNIFYVLRY